VIDLFERILLLKRSMVFSEVSTDDLRHVAQALEEERYFGGDRVFDIGDQGDHMYILVSGKIGLSLDEAPGGKAVFAVLGPGEHFGEMNLLDGLPRSATAQVLEDSRLLVLEKTRLHGLIMSYPEISLGMLRRLSLRVRDAHGRQTRGETGSSGSKGGQ
jgi:CRP-like cAMP-binding protein